MKTVLGKNLSEDSSNYSLYIYIYIYIYMNIYKPFRPNGPHQCSAGDQNGEAYII